MSYTSDHRTELMNKLADRAERLLELIHVQDEIAKKKQDLGSQPCYPEVEDGIPQGFRDRVSKYYDSLSVFYASQRPGIMAYLDLNMWLLTHVPNKKEGTQC